MPWMGGRAPPVNQCQGTVIVEVPESRAHLLAVQRDGDWTADIGE